MMWFQQSKDYLSLGSFVRTIMNNFLYHQNFVLSHRCFYNKEENENAKFSHPFLYVIFFSAEFIV